MVVIRKIAGDPNLYVYASNRADANIIATTLVNTLTVQHNAPLAFGGRVMADGHVDSRASGTIYWAKLWYGDLGQTNCRKLASWTHSIVTMQAVGNDDYTFDVFKRVDNNHYVNCCFLMKELLDITTQMHSSASNLGGWAGTTYRTWANTRFLNALPDQWLQLILEVETKTTAGGGSKEIVTANDFVWAPTSKALGLGVYTEPYANEGDAWFNIFVPDIAGSDTRIKHLNNGDGYAHSYWTASPYYSANGSTGQMYYRVVADDGSATLGNATTTISGICLGICI